MYSILLAPIVSALYFMTEEPFIVQSVEPNTVYYDTNSFQAQTQDTVKPLYTTTTPSLFTTECVDITLQNQVPVTMTQEQFITFTNYNKDYSVVYNTITSTVTQETFSVESFVTSTCTTAEINELTVQAESSCSSENVSVYTTDLFILNSVETDCPTVTNDFQIQDITSSIMYNVSTTVVPDLTIDVQIQDISTSLFGDLEALPVTTSVTSEISTTSTQLIGDLEGLPTPIANETLPEITIEEIPDTEVPEIRDDGLQFCAAVGLGDFVANGTQQQFQTCSLTVQGAIPAIDKMVSTIIISPENNAVIALGTNFTITIKSLNIEYGFFDDPASLYYLSPQRLNANGIIQGHNHVAIQKLLGPGEVPSAQNPLFFKGLNEQSLDGTLSTEVNGDLFTETGEYRLCTSSASQGHQPVLSPVARRFFQDDCIRFTIVN